jgi:hypothetical protein
MDRPEKIETSNDTTQTSTSIILENTTTSIQTTDENKEDNSSNSISSDISFDITAISPLNFFAFAIIPVLILGSIVIRFQRYRI